MDQVINENVILSRGESLLNNNNTSITNTTNAINTYNSLVKQYKPTTLYSKISEQNDAVNNQSQLKSNRFNFIKSHTCGSLYAKCSCSLTTTTTTSAIATAITTIPQTSVAGHAQRRKKLFQSYSHPDTSYIFTNADKNPINVRDHNCITTKNGLVELSHSKRLSSPNIGNYTIIDVAVHPEVVLTVSQRNNSSRERLSSSSSSTPISSSPSSSPSPTSGITTTTTTTINKSRSPAPPAPPALSSSPSSPIPLTPTTLLPPPIKPIRKKSINSDSDLNNNNNYYYNFNTIIQPQINRSKPKPILKKGTNVNRSDSYNSIIENSAPSIKDDNIIINSDSQQSELSNDDGSLGVSSSTINSLENNRLIVSSSASVSPVYYRASIDLSEEYTDVFDINGRNDNLDYLKFNAIGHQQQQQQQQQQLLQPYQHQQQESPKILNVIDPAEKFFKESGILGPMGNGTSGALRKTSKVVSDPVKIEQIRKNSRVIMRQVSERQKSDYDDDFVRLILGQPNNINNNNTNNNNNNIMNINNNNTNNNNNNIMNINNNTNNNNNNSSSNNSSNNNTCNVKLKSSDRQQPQDDDDSNEPKIKSLEDQVLRLKDTIKDRDSEINKLKREIHKLKSVLQQTTNLQSGANSDILSSLQTNHCMAGQKATHNCNLSETISDCTANLCNNLQLNLQQQNTTISSSSPSSSSSLCLLSSATLHASNSHPHLLTAAIKKQGVSGESCDTTGQLSSSDIFIRKYDKDFRSKQLIKDAIMDNDFLKNIDSSQIRELVDSMYSREVKIDEYVIREGEAGAHLFVAAEGEFEVIKDGKVLGKMGPGKAFGELAILYNCTRTASIKVLCNSRVWVLDRRVFQQIMMRTGMQRIEENVNFLKSVPLLKNLSKDLLAKIADVLEVEFYPAGAYVIRQGTSGDTFYLISQGTVQVTQRVPNTTLDEEIRQLNRGDYFGEQALLKEDKRTANIIAMPPGVECLTLDRESFSLLIGDLCELHEKDYGDESRVLSMKSIDCNSMKFGSDTKQELLDVELDDLDIVATLGIGGFGRVELVKYEKSNQTLQTYALKCLKKQHIVDTRQEEHIYSERTIMLSCNSPFICRLYRTYRDTKYVYMLLEACMGGEIWTILRDTGYFKEVTAQFIIGCVLQAFEYLHTRGIVYRDLKPENLMLDSKGYIKLVDFGFAKYIGYSCKTWTFCGTPEYVAPEIILNRGHDRAVDYWALGILIHELLTGTPPFTASDPMKTYNIILKGIDMIDFPKHMSRTAITLIKKLCRDVPAERLGYQKGGIQDIKKNKWFQGFDWDGLANLTLTPPLIQPIENVLDMCNFDNFPMDVELPPDEFSGWDKDF